MLRAALWFVSILCAINLAFALREKSVAKNFLPDETFKGSSLAGWTPIGDAKWRANQGQITGAGSTTKSFVETAVPALLVTEIFPVVKGEYGVLATSFPSPCR